MYGGWGDHTEECGGRCGKMQHCIVHDHDFFRCIGCEQCANELTENYG